MLGHFIKPLKTQNGTEALQNVIVDTEFQVSAGLLRSPREVEVALTSSAKVREWVRMFLMKLLTCSVVLQISSILRKIPRHRWLCV